MVLDFGWLNFFFFVIYLLTCWASICSNMWWSLFPWSQLLLSAPVAPGCPVHDEEPSLIDFAGWNSVLSARRGETLLIPEVLSGWETTCDIADVPFIVFQHLLFEGELQQSSFKDCFVLGYLMKKRKLLVPFLLKFWQRVFFLLLRSQLVIKTRCHFNEDENI